MIDDCPQTVQISISLCGAIVVHWLPINYDGIFTFVITLSIPDVQYIYSKSKSLDYFFRFHL